MQPSQNGRHSGEATRTNEWTVLKHKLGYHTTDPYLLWDNSVKQGDIEKVSWLELHQLGILILSILIVV